MTHSKEELQGRSRYWSQASQDPYIALGEFKDSPSTDDLESLILQCQNPDNAAFASFIRTAQETLGWDDDRCAEMFDVSRPSVSRWKEGTSAPRRIVAKYVYHSIKVEATKMLEWAKTSNLAGFQLLGAVLVDPSRGDESDLALVFSCQGRRLVVCPPGMRLERMLSVEETKEVFDTLQLDLSRGDVAVSDHIWVLREMCGGEKGLHKVYSDLTMAMFLEGVTEEQEVLRQAASLELDILVAESK